MERLTICLKALVRQSECPVLDTHQVCNNPEHLNVGLLQEETLRDEDTLGSLADETQSRGRGGDQRL